MSPPPSHEPEIQTSRTSEESDQLRNLLDLVSRMESRVESLEKELSDTKQTLGTAVLKLIKKVTKLETKLRQKRKREETEDDEDAEGQDQDIPSQTDQGNKFANLIMKRQKGVLPPTTQEEQFADEKERKARTLLLMAVPKDHLRRFHGMDDAKEIWAAIKTRFGGNANSKKMQKAVLKQQFEAFTISSKESLEKGYDRFQKLLSQLDALGAGVSDEDANHKFLRSLPPAWDSLAMTMRTKKNIDTLSIDDLYNNLSVFEQDIQKTSSSSLASDNVAFLSQAKASSSKHKPSQSSGSYSSYTTSSSKAKPTATPGLADEVIHSFLATNADDVDLIHEDLDQIDDLDLEEMDINWQIAMTAIKIKKFYKKTGRRPRVDGKMHWR
ncbi:hypothetical protein Tco_1476442 [Tanacetum coccineum]